MTMITEHFTNRQLLVEDCQTVYIFKNLHLTSTDSSYLCYLDQYNLNCTFVHYPKI